MKEYPILFSPEMVRQILAGRKTQTRRLPKPAELLTRTPPYRVGDILWVRERWRKFDYHTECACYEECNCYRHHGSIVYAADVDDPESVWKPSIFLKRSDSRIDLLVKEVLYHQLQDITETEALAEGFCDAYHPDFHVGAFRDYWETLHPGTWEQNPLVRVTVFEMVKCQKNRR